MFRENNGHRQQSFFSSTSLLPDTVREKLLESWAGTFYREVFCRIDEKTFAPLYSEKDSRPNVPVNVLVGAEILKSGFGWSDEALHEEICFNLQVRYALGMDDLREEVFTLRTLYNFRRRVVEYAQETGVNLMQKVFEQVTDEQLEAVGLVTGWQRMDSTQVLSNLVGMTRLELLVAVLQAVHRQLPEEMGRRWGERWAIYVNGRPHQVCSKIPMAEVGGHLVAIGRELCAVEAELGRQLPESKALVLARRVLGEQYDVGDDGVVQVRPPEAVSPAGLQSPHDPEATYRVKGGKVYRGGYVVNVSETADPKNPLQLMTDLQVEPNVTDDAALLEQSLEGQAERGIEVERLTTDGGYTGPSAERACQEHGVELRATRMRGGRSGRGKWGYEAYTWEMDGEGRATHVTCPQGCRVPLTSGAARGRLIARFAEERCAACPHLGKECRVRPRKRAGPTLHVGERAIKVARQRKGLHPEDTPIRVLVESTIRSLTRPFANRKLPVRGLTRARMVVYGVALMVNARRLHRYFAERGETALEKVAFSVSRLKKAVSRCWQPIRRHCPQPAPSWVRQQAGVAWI